MKRVAVFFPGMGYHTDRPLFYYTKKLLRKADYEIIEVDYEGIDTRVFDEIQNYTKLFSASEHGEALESFIHAACKRVLEQLATVDFRQYNEVLFVAKSIGTVISQRVAQESVCTAKLLLLTPIEMALHMVKDSEAVAFCGTADPIAPLAPIRTLCEQKNIPMFPVEGGNHSLETGDVEVDIDNLKTIMTRVSEWIAS